jgi:hypothetical protein
VLVSSPRVRVSRMTRMATLTKVFAAVVSVATCVIDCSGRTGGEPGPASGGPGSTPCAQMGGVCQNGLTCVDGLAYRGSLRGLCGSDFSSLCCVQLDANGRLPSQLGSAGVCGPIVCDPGSTCVREVDVEACTTGCYVPPRLLDAGCASCGSISCDLGCPCLDATRNHCGC